MGSRRHSHLMLAVLLAVCPTLRLSAQVGHDPNHSPYHDIQRGGDVRFIVGYLGGGRGAVPVGISGGPTFGIRYETMLSGAVSFTAGAAYGQTTRRIVDPYVAKAVRTSRLIDCDVVLADLALQLSLTGAKSWHGFSPYLNGGMGIAVGSELASDSSQYTFGTKFAPEVGAGFRFYPIGIRRLSFQADIRAVYWRLQYPLSFKLASPADGTVVLPVTAPDAQWTRHSWISIGVGWNF